MNTKTDTENTELKVLVLEDSPRDLELMRNKLSAAGHLLDLTHVDNKEAFTAALRKDNFNLILSDFKLPGFDAFVALEISQKLSPETPFICVSGVIGEETAVELLKMGAVDYVLKDRPERLPYAVKRALEQAKVTADYQKAAQELKKSVAQFDDMASGSCLNEIVYHNGEPINYRILKINPAFEKILGIKRDKAVGALATEVYNTKEPPLLDVFSEVARTGIPQDLEHYFQPTGQYLHLTVGCPKPGFFSTVFSDITGRKNIEKELKEKTSFLSTIMETSPVGIVSVDKTGNIIYANKRAEQILGLEKKEITSITYNAPLWNHIDLDGTPLPDEKQPFNIIKKSLNTALNIQHGITWPDGTIVILSINASPIKDHNGEFNGMIASIEDISEHKRSEIALKESEEKFRILADTAKVMIAIVADAGGEKFLYVNDEWERVYGYSKEEAQYLKPIDLVAPEYRQNLLKKAAERIEGKQLSSTYELKTITKNGQDKYIDFSSTIINFGNQKAFLTTAIDITDRKKAEDALRQNKEMMVNSQSVAHICSYSTNLNVAEIDKSQWVCSPEFYKIFGIDETYPHTIAGWAAFIHPDFREKIFAYHESVVKEKKSFNREYKIIRINDGAERWVHGTGELVYDAQGNPVRMHGAIQDITERKRAEMIKKVLYNIASAMITIKNLNELFDTVRNELNTIIDANNFFIALYNEETRMVYSPIFKDEKDEYWEWPVEKTATGLVIKKGQPVLLKREDALKLKEEGLMEIVGTPSEAWLGIPLKVGDKILGAIVVQNYDNPDVYDQTSIEIMQLVANELSVFIDWQLSIETALKLSRAVEQSSVSIMITNNKGIVEYVNPFFSKLTGYSFEEVIGKNPNLLKSGHQSKEFYEELWKTILSGKDWVGEMLNKNKSGGLYWVNAVISPIVNSQGVLTKFVAIKEDITSKKEMISELIAAKDKAEEMNRVKSYFFANMSHELRTPFVGIMGYADLLKSEIENEDYKEMLNGILNASKRMLGTLDNILNLTRNEFDEFELNFKPVNLKDILDSLSEEFLIQTAAKGLRFMVNNRIEKIIFNTDENVFREILSNLIRNAVKFTETGSIEINSELEVTDEQKFLVIKVIDTGIGIPEDKQSLIFDIFRQVSEGTARDFQGSGLGLAIVKKEIKKLGGTITVKSELSKGSTFTVRLPV